MQLKNHKLQFQVHVSRTEQPHLENMMAFNEKPPLAPPATPEDLHLELLQKVTNHLDNLSINLVQGRRIQPQPPNKGNGQNAPPP